METLTQIVQYRNSIYQGSIKNGKRFGKGILITDTGYILVGTWKNDQLFGKGFIQINNDQSGFGDFNRGEIQGYFLFRKRQKTIFSQFNSSKPINQMLLIDSETNKTQVLSYRSPNFQVIQEIKTQGMTESQIIDRVAKIKIATPDTLSFLQKQFCDETTFAIKILSNGNYLFYWNDKVNPISLGFVINKNGQLISYGSYLNHKLHGIGCKYQNNIRYQGMFINGFMNGYGLKLSKGKYSYGRFQQGNLVEAILLEERSDLSQQKLREVKKLEHIKSIYFWNGYVKSNIIKFKGFSEVTFQQQAKQQYLYPKPQIKQSPTKNLALRLMQQQRDDFETKSSRSFLLKKNPQQDDQMSQIGQPRGGLSGLRRFNNV